MPAFKVQWVPWRSLGKNLTCVFWNLGTYLNTKDCAWRFWRTRTCWLSPGKWNKKRLCYRELKKKVRKSPPYSRFPHLSEGAERDLHVWHLACMHAKSLSRVWLFATLWTVCSPPDSSVHEILQARILEWVPMPFSRGSSWPRDRTHVSYVSCIGRQVLYH